MRSKKTYIHKANNSIKWLFIIALFLSLITIIGLTIIAKILPITYIVSIIIILGAITALLITFNLKNDFEINKKTIIISSIDLLVVIIFISIIIFLGNINSFLNNIEASNYIYTTYNIITKNNNQVELKHNNQTIGLVTGDQNKEEIIKIVRNKTTAKEKDINDYTSLITSVNNNTIDTAVIRTSYLQMLQENSPELYKNIKVLYKFSIKTAYKSNSNTDITKPFVIYISGIDTYGEVTSVSRSDVNILAVVNPEKHKILLVNTPRDYYVQLHGTTGVRDKLTHAGIYGIEMSKNTLQDLYNTEINYYVRVNFTSLLEIIDAIGGIEVYSDYSFKTNHYSFKEGYNQLDSKQALEFSRERHAFEGGDNTRGRNQQRVIEAIIMKASNPTELIKYQNTLKLLGNSIQTDMSRDEITTLLNQQMDTLKKWQTESIAVTGTGKTATTYSMGSMPLYVMEPNSESLFIAKETIQSYKK